MLSLSPGSQDIGSNECELEIPADSFGICPPPRSKSRRSTMFAFRKNRTLVVSRSPEAFIQDAKCSTENKSPNENMSNQVNSFSPDKTSSHKAIYTPSPPSTSTILPQRSPLSETKVVSPTSSDLDIAPFRQPTQRPPVKLLSPISSLTPPKAENLAGTRCKLSIESSCSDLIISGHSSSCLSGSCDGDTGSSLASDKDVLIARLKRKVIKMREQRQQHLSIITMSREETESMRFLNAIQELKIEELTSSLSLNAIEKQEALTQRSKKYKQALNKLKQEKEAYEQRANGVIMQLNEQMASLQTVAMERITVLEKELMAARRDNEELRKVCVSRGNHITAGCDLPSSNCGTVSLAGTMEAAEEETHWTEIQPDEVSSREDCDSEAV